jgi:hypothetical protein
MQFAQRCEEPDHLEYEEVIDLRIRFAELPFGCLLRDQEIGMTHSLISEETGAIVGYVRRAEVAREISQSSGVVDNDAPLPGFSPPR